MEYRKATIHDLAPLTQLCITTFVDTYAIHNTEKNLHLYLEKAFNPIQLSQELQSETEAYFLITDQQLPVAYVKLNYHCYPPDATGGASMTEIQRIYVMEEYQGKGLGKELLDISANAARQIGTTHLWLGVWEKNPKAIEFYEKNGFRKTGTHHFWLGEDCQTDFIMQKQI